MEEVFYRYNKWWDKSEFLHGVIPRPESLKYLIDNFNSKHIIFLTGLRRVGKTTLIKLLIKYLIERSGIDPQHILYLSLDDYLLAKKNIIELVDFFRRIHGLRFDQKVYLFFDEVAYHEDFEQQLKNLYDSHNVKVYASSSSSSILKSRKSFLTGRNAVIEILPLDFTEYMIFKEIVLSKRDSHLEEKYFEDFLKTGGIPEYVLSGNMDYLRELVDDIIYKDIAAIHNIKNPQLLKDYFLLLMERAGKMISINKMANILSISPDTSKRYFNLFSSTYLIHTVNRYGKTNERIISQKKIYAADLGIRTLFTGFRDKGSLFENYVYLKIKKKNPSYLYQDGAEIDFITEDHILIESKYKSNFSNKQRILFDGFKAKKKIIINELRDIAKLTDI